MLSALVITTSAVDPGEVRIRSGPWSPPATRISVDSRLVEIVVTVRDHNGKLMQGLEQADFEVFDGGKPEKITFFSVRSLAGEKTSGKISANVPHDELPPRAPSPCSSTIQHAEPFGIDRAKNAAEKLVRSSLHPAESRATAHPMTRTVPGARLAS